MEISFISVGMCRVLCKHLALDTTVFFLLFEGIGLRSVCRTNILTYWVSWDDAASMITKRRRSVAVSFVQELMGRTGWSTHLSAAVEVED